jgi:adenosylcobinamide-phosphate synthase
VRPRRAADVWRVVRRDAASHPSPNGGVAEAAFAAALGLRLGGENRYGERIELRPTLGDGRSAEPTDIARAVRLSRDVTYALAVALGIGAVR